MECKQNASYIMENTIVRAYVYINKAFESNVTWS